MTAEIAILNRNAVAMAADSAVTIQMPGGQKIYNTVNKLFALSKYRPVGVMVYGTADLMQVPWETIIKMYRSELRDGYFNTLEEYAEDFIAFFERENLLFPPTLQARYAVDYIEEMLSIVRSRIDSEVKSVIEKIGSIDEVQLKVLITDETSKVTAEVEQREFLPSFGETDVKACADTHAAAINERIEKIFQKLPVEHCRDRLHHLSALVLCKKYRRLGYSGVVVAGFGERDVYPTLLAYECEWVHQNKLRYVASPKVKVGHGEGGTVSASLLPFAQREMVNRFMEGVDPKYRDAVNGYISALLTNGYPQKIADVLSGKIPDDMREALRKELSDLGANLVKDFSSGILEFQREQFVDPIIASVASLPKDELAAMAESLVNLTAFKRRMTSVEADTVGLPIDVAVISKGDGFIWIKRKHYFEPELNPSFFANYYRKDEVRGNAESKKRTPSNS